MGAMKTWSMLVPICVGCSACECVYLIGGSMVSLGVKGGGLGYMVRYVDQSDRFFWRSKSAKVEIGQSLGSFWHCEHNG